MGKVIAFANQKGGVAKTTSTYNVGTALARAVKKLAIVKKSVYEGKAVTEQAPTNDAAAEYQKVAECIMEKGGI